MPQILKPSGLNTRWAQSGDILDPGNTKYAQGWDIEIPPRQWFNFLDNRQDEAIAHINQHGIAVWDNVTEYQASKSYVQGSDGNLYKAVTTNTNINPVGDAGTNWTLIATFAIASTAQAQALTSNTTLLTPLRLDDAFKGVNQSLAPFGFQKYPGGKLEQWGTVVVSLVNGAGSATVALPTTFPTQYFQGVGTFIQTLGGLGGRIGTDCPTTSTIQIEVAGVGTFTGPQTVRFLAWGK